MTVGELIANLSELDPDMPVVLDDFQEHDLLGRGCVADVKGVVTGYRLDGDGFVDFEDPRMYIDTLTPVVMIY